MKGVDEEYDAFVRSIGAVEDQLKTYLENLIERSKERAAKGSDSVPNASSWKQVQFVHSKYPYEIEAPDKHRFWKDVQGFDRIAVDVTSTRAGFVRFRTTEILEFGE